MATNDPLQETETVSQAMPQATNLDAGVQGLVEACESFTNFFRATAPCPGYLYGRHTKVLLERLQSVSDDLLAGRSRHLCVSVPGHNP